MKGANDIYGPTNRILANLFGLNGFWRAFAAARLGSVGLGTTGGNQHGGDGECNSQRVCHEQIGNPNVWNTIHGRAVFTSIRCIRR